MQYKTEKAQKFYKEILEKEPDVLVTYGSSSSNHCRIIANLAKALGISCQIISPEENNHETANSKIVSSLGAKVKYCAVSRVKETIDETIAELEKTGKPYFIMGGGHGNPGTEGYIDAYREILEYEKEQGMHFDYIFHASGTGATQAGLIVGQLLSKKDDWNTEGQLLSKKNNQNMEGQFSKKDVKQKIVGISIARLAQPGGKVVLESVADYLEAMAADQRITVAEKESMIKEAEEQLCFTDKYRLEGYGSYNESVLKAIEEAEHLEGIAMDTTYVGKAFWGMQEYLREEKIEGKKILFIHTGGTPLYFNRL